jgi:leishmanolysin-like peptidase
VSPLLPNEKAGGRSEHAFIHISDWYTTFLMLARAKNPTDTGPGRFDVDGRNLWPYLSVATPPRAAPPPFIGGNRSTTTGGGSSGLSPSTSTADTPLLPSFANGILVIGFNYSTMLYPVNGGYDKGTGAIIEVSTGYKLIMGSQNLCQDCLQWDPREYPCNRTADGEDCTPHCLFNILDDPSERLDLSQNATVGGADPASVALARMLKAYDAVGKGEGMPNMLDKEWNEQGTPWDPQACATAHRFGGYWRPWLPAE